MANRWMFLNLRDARGANALLIGFMRFLADAVFAVALVLLALELNFLDVGLISIWWLIHRHLSRRLMKFDWLTAGCNVFLLASVFSLPFAATNLGVDLPVEAYWGAKIVAAVSMVAMFFVMMRGEARLVGGLAPGEWLFRLMQSLAPGIAIAAQGYFGTTGQVWPAIFSWALMLPIVGFGRLFYRTPAERARAQLIAGVGHWRTYAALRRDKLDLRANQLLDQLTPAELSVAAENPDHSPAGRDAARAALPSHAFGEGPDDPIPSAPSFLEIDDVSRVVPHGFYGVARLVRYTGALVFWMAVVYLIGSGSLDWLWIFAGGALWVLGGMSRAKPARILLLRKFNNPDIDKLLRTFVKRNLSPMGHVFALSDRYFRRSAFDLTPLLMYWSPTFWVPILVLVPLDFIRGRLNGSSAGGRITVRSSTDFRQFGRRIIDRVSCNTQVLTTGRRTIPVHASDTWWKHVARFLMESADVIVVDLSDVTEGTEWELDRLVEFALLDRTVFIVRKDAQDALAETFKRFQLWTKYGVLNPVAWRDLVKEREQVDEAFDRMGETAAGRNVFAYRENGWPERQGAFYSAIRSALKARLGATGA